MLPCIGENLNFDFFHSQLLHSNLGGLGPDTTAPQGVRYVNVAKVVAADGSVAYLDLDLVNTTAYTPYDASRNGMNGRFAQISFAANTDVGLRVYVRKSCATADSCSYCDDTAYYPSNDQRDACYAAGCGCFG